MAIKNKTSNTHGGSRKGAGRPSHFNEKTKPIRLPINLIDSVKKYVDNNAYLIPLFGAKVPAGFPTAAEDDVVDLLNLNEHLIKHPNKTYLVRASGNSMINAGIYENDLLVVDRSLSPVPGKIVIAAIDGQLTVKRLQQNKNSKFILAPENSDYAPIEVSEESNVHIWGVVTFVIHSV